MIHHESFILEYFSSENAEVHPEDVEPMLKALGKVRTLRKFEVRLTNKVCEYLSDLSNLKELVIWNRDLTKTVIPEIAKLKLLKKVRFINCDGSCGNCRLLENANPQLSIEWRDYDYDNDVICTFEEYCEFHLNETDFDFSCSDSDEEVKMEKKMMFLHESYCSRVY